MNRIALMFAVVLILSVTEGFADYASRFDEGLHQYRVGNLDSALVIWGNILGEGKASGELLYNIGNVYYRNGNIGRAILFYERAHRLLRRDADVTNNLTIARLGTVDKIEKPVRLVIWDWIDNVRDCLSLRELSRLLQVAGLLAALLLSARLIPPARWRITRSLRTAFHSSLTLLLIVAGWYVWRTALDARHYAIVLSDKTESRSGPDESATELFALHEGTKVLAKEILGGWVKITLEDGRGGWILMRDVDII